MKSLPKTLLESTDQSNNPPDSPPAQQSLSRRQALARFAAGAIALPILQGRTASAESPLTTIAARADRRTTSPTEFKSAAISDYAANMARFGGQLASPIQNLLTPCARGVPWQFDVIVIGSGYGASITAARLAKRLRPGSRLAIIERGREWSGHFSRPGQ